jgi:RNase P subunit RPR2
MKLCPKCKTPTEIGPNGRYCKRCLDGLWINYLKKLEEKHGSEIIVTCTPSGTNRSLLEQWRNDDCGTDD